MGTRASGERKVLRLFVQRDSGIRVEEDFAFVLLAIWRVTLRLENGISHQSFVVAGVGLLLPCCASFAVFLVYFFLQGRKNITRMHPYNLPPFLSESKGGNGKGF